MVYVFLADGFEEIEAITPVDVLRRASVAVTTVGVGSKMVQGAHGIPVVCDTTEDEADFANARMIVLPGGMPGTKNLGASSHVKKAIEYMREQGRFIAAICAAPSILGNMGLLDGRDFTCFPGFEDSAKGGHYTAGRVVQSGNIITAKGPGAAEEFSLTLAGVLASQQKAQSVKAAMQCRL